MDSMNGLTTVNVELTSRCNKNCWMCGRRKVERDYPELAMAYGDMGMKLVTAISNQLPSGIVVQFHDNGEPLLYPRFGEAVRLFSRQIRCMDTNGKLLLEKADEIIGNLDTITVSTFERDPEADEQYAIVKEFLALKGNRKPNVIVRCLGNVNPARYEEMGCLIANRTLHHPLGSFQYEQTPTVPEIGICLDALSHLVIHHTGKVSMCVRFDPKELGVIGDANVTPLSDIWNSPLRLDALADHISGNRNGISLCSTCDYWGVPTGGPVHE